MADDQLELADDELLAASRADPEQFGRFYDRHAAAVYGFCARRTASAQVAEDLTAEVFAIAYAKRGTFRRMDVPVRAWLYGIARRLIATFHRRQRVADRYRRRFGMTATATADDQYDQVDSLVDGAALRAELDGALLVLPAGQQDAVRLRIVEQLPYWQVAQELGCSEGAARVRVSRALTRLAQTLEDA